MNTTWSQWLGRLRNTGSRAHKRAVHKAARSRLAVEHLEDRSVPAAMTYVNDTWHLFQDTTNDGLSVGDFVTNANDSGSLTAYMYGTQAFGTVTTGVRITTPTSLAGSATINDAIANTDVGGTVNVLEGTYSELVTVNKTVTLLGKQAGVDARTRTGAPESVVNGALVDNDVNDDMNPTTRTTAFYITAANVTIDGFTVRDQSDPQFGAGIVIGPSGVIVRNNIITNNTIGVFANATGASLIERNLFDSNNTSGASGGAGIYSDSSNGLTINNNEFRNHTINNPIIFGAVGAGAHTNLTVTNNSIHDNISGIFALGISGGLFQGNTITTGGTATALTFGGANTGIDVLRNDLSGNLRGLRIADYGYFGATPNSDIEAHFNSFANNSVYGAGVSNESEANSPALTDGYTGPLDLTANWWGDVTGPTSADNPGGGGSALRNDFADAIDFQPWLLYGDADPVLVGFQIPMSFTVTAQTTNFTATNNNYRRLVNAFDPLQPGQTMILSGTFDWTEPNAAASWALGNDGVASAADDYSLLVVPNINNVTVTAASLGAARIQGPGDLAAVNLEGFLTFDGGDNQNWTISNLEIFDFDLGIGMFNGAGGVDAFNGTTITNNRIRIATDLNSVAAPADVNQNIGIHYSFGTNQTISNNQIDIPGDGVSDPSADLTANRAAFSSTVGMQSNTSGGAVYDGLQITGNVIRVLNAQNATNPQRTIGIWENGQAHASDITVSGNQFLNAAAGNNPTTNLQQAFWVTSHSGAGTTVTYSGNTVQGANIGFKWLGDPEFPGQNFAGTQAVVLSGNTLTNVQTGFLVQSNGLATFTGTGNSVTGTPTGLGIDVRAGSIVSVLGGSFTGTGVGIDVNGGTARIQGVNLNNNSIAGLRVQNGAQVDAGGGGYTGLGTSTGGNDFSSYLPAGPGRAIINLNTDAASGGFVAAPPDMRAQNNIFASPSLAFIEQVVNHDVDVATQGFVDFGGPQAGANDAPVAAPGTLTTAEDTAATGTLVATDVDSPTLTYSIVDQSGANGVVTITNAATGAYSYTPNLNYNGPASFTFKANDGTMDSNTATVSITVSPVNDAPVAQAGALATAEDTATTGVLGATDVDGPSLTFALVNVSNAHGTVTITNAATGAFSYTPDLDYSGPASFTFNASDGALTSNTATVSITVTASSAPVVTNPPGPSTASGPAITGASIVFGFLVLNGPDGQPFAFIPVPPGSFVLFVDVNGDRNRDVVLFTPTAVFVLDGFTGRFLALIADTTGDGRRELFVFSVTTGALQLLILGTGEVFQFSS